MPHPDRPAGLRACCALLTARWPLAAACGGFAVALGIVLGIPDQIFATPAQYGWVAGVAVTAVTATLATAMLQRQQP